MSKILPLITALLLIFSSTQLPNKNEESQQETQGLVYTAKVERYIPGLSDKLHEISGLMIWNGLYWGFNDSGGEAILYGFDILGEIKMELELKDVRNHDWESLAQNESHIFVGDFGNNHGNRKDLTIYKIKKSDIDKNDKKQEVETKKINFSYSEQLEFGSALSKTQFDCEAFVELDGKLHLFSKNWKERTTEHYQVPVEKGDYEVNETESFDVKGLVTGADISPDKKILALLAYENWKAFIWLFSDFAGDDFFEGKSRLLKLPELNDAQTEGICFLNNDTLLVSCEANQAFRQQVFLINLKQLRDGTSQDQ